MTLFLLPLLLLLAVFSSPSDSAPSIFNGPPCPSSSYHDVHEEPVILKAIETADSILQNVTAALPGAFVMVVLNNRAVYQKGFGRRDPRDPTSEPPSSQTLFRFGSVTKVFTALWMLRLMESGQLSNFTLDTPVTDLYPHFKVANSFPGLSGPITLRMLAAHTSGLVPEAPCLDDGVAGQDFDAAEECPLTECTLECVVERLVELPLQFAPGTDISYSNLGFALLGRVLESYTHLNYEETLVSDVFRPLNMVRAGFSSSQGKEKAVGTHYGLDGDLPPTYITDWPSPQFNTPNGDMYGCAEDLAAFLMHLLQPASGMSVLRDATRLAEWLQPVYLNSDGVTGMGMPWEIQLLNASAPRISHNMVLTKLGEVPGYTTHIAAIPRLRLGVLALANTDKPPADPSRITMPLIELFAPILDDLLSQTAINTPANPARFAGIYIAPSTKNDPQPGRWTVTLNNHILSLQDFQNNTFAISETISPIRGHEEVYQLAAMGNDVSTCLSREFDGRFGAWINFQMDESTKAVKSFTMPGLTWRTMFIKQ